MTIYGDHIATNHLEIQSNAHVWAHVHHKGVRESEQKFEAALSHPDYVYSRFRQGSVWAYRRDTTSPSGVMLIAGTSSVEFAEEALRRIRNNSPLSPTEGLQSSGARLW